MSWTDIKKEAIAMWMRTFRRFKIYIVMKNNRRRVKEKKKKKK